MNKAVDNAAQGITESRVERLERWAERHEDSQDQTTTRIFTALDEIRKDLAHRLPPWASIIIALLTGAVGALLGVLCTVGGGG